MYSLGSSSLAPTLLEQIHQLPKKDCYSTNLIIADLHPGIDEKIEKLNVDDDAIVLRHNNESLSDNEQFSGAINYACQEFGVRTIIVLGHSLVARSSNNQKNGVSEKRLLNRVADAQRRLQKAKNKLVGDLKYCLYQVSSVSQSGSEYLEVLGVFYLNESGIFLLYQPETGTFAPFSESLACY